MACFGSKALQKRKPKSQNTQMAGEDTLPKQRDRKKSLQEREPRSQNTQMAGEDPLRKHKDRKKGKSMNKNRKPNNKEHSKKDKAPHKSSKHPNPSIPQASILRFASWFSNSILFFGVDDDWSNPYLI